MVQRAGRIDRIGSKHLILWVHNMFPEAGLERLLRLVENLNRKIIDIDRTGFLDASVLGETVRLFFLNEKWVANGSKGLYRIPEFLGEWVSPKYYDYLYVVVVLVVLAVLFLNQSQGEKCRGVG